MNTVDKISIEWDEDRCYLFVDCADMGDEPEDYRFDFQLFDPEQAYDAVKAAILPWLMERDAAKAEYDRAKRQSDTRDLSDEEFSAYLDDAYGDNWAKRVGMEQMREQGYA